MIFNTGCSDCSNPGVKNKFDWVGTESDQEIEHEMCHFMKIVGKHMEILSKITFKEASQQYFYIFWLYHPSPSSKCVCNKL